MPRLNPGDPFPKLTLSTTDGQLTTDPDAFACDFGVVLFYPGTARRARRQARHGQPAETDGSLTMRQKHSLHSRLRRRQRANRSQTGDLH